jgi:hypothetical protein
VEGLRALAKELGIEVRIRYTAKDDFPQNWITTHCSNM